VSRVIRRVFEPDDPAPDRLLWFDPADWDLPEDQAVAAWDRERRAWHAVHARKERSALGDTIALLRAQRLVRALLTMRAGGEALGTFPLPDCWTGREPPLWMASMLASVLLSDAEEE